MKKLSLLIQSLSSEEKDLIVRYYLIKNNLSKRLKLFNLIMVEGVSNDEDAAQKLYRCKPNAAFSQLKKRLTEDILNLLLTNEHLSNEPKSFQSAEALATKKVLHSKMLFSRGLNREAIVSLKKAFKLAQEHEAYEVQALAHGVLKSYSDSLKKEEVEDLEQQFFCNIDIFYQLLDLEFQRDDNLVLERKSQYLSIIDKKQSETLEVSFHGSKSLRLQFLTTVRKIECCFENRQYQQCFELAESILPYVEKGDHVISPNHKANFYLNISKALMGLNQYESSIDFGKRSCDLFAPFEEKRLEALIGIFKSHFYNNDFEEAEMTLKVCDEAKSHVQKVKSELTLFRSFHQFIKGDYKKSVKTLNTFFRHSKLDINLVLNGKLLELLNLLEMKDYEWFDYKLNSFRKVVYYHADETLYERFAIIHKVFSYLKKVNYSKESLKAHYDTSLLLKLREKKSQYSWDPLSSELIPVQSWLSYR